MFVNENNLKKLPQAGVILPSLELDSATSVRGDNFIMKEIWKDIIGIESDYQVSNLGRVRGKNRTVSNGRGTRFVKSKIRAISINPNKYHVTSVLVNGKPKTIFIHKEVAKCFIPNPENKPEVNHKDGNKNNNNKSNLEWVTRLENIEHAFRNKLIVPAVGVNQSRTKLTEKQVKYILDNPNIGAREMARKLKLNSHSTVSSIRLGKSWNHISGLPRNPLLPKLKFDL